MKSRLKFLFSMIFIFSSFLITAEDKKLITVKELIEKNKRASDPSGNYSKSKSYMRIQKLSFNSGFKKVSGEIITKFKSPANLKKIIFINGKIETIEIFDGKNAWRIRKDKKSGKTDILQKEGLQLKYAKLDVEIANPKKSYTDVYDSLKVKTVTENHETFYKLICSISNEKNIAPLEVFFSSETFLTRKIKTELQKNGKNFSFVSEPVKYIVIDGVVLPSESHNFISGIKQKLILEDFKLNPKIDKSEFNIDSYKNKNFDELADNKLYKN